MNFDLLIHALADSGAAFIVIGGWAAILSGSVRTTRDLDVCFERTIENCNRIARALAPFQPRLRDLSSDLPFVWDATMLFNISVCTLTTKAGAIDLLAEVTGLGTFPDVKAASKSVQAFDRDIWALDLPGLILAKRAAGRPKDMQALPELEGLLEASED